MASAADGRPCVRFRICGRDAVKEQFDERTGLYQPVCAVHLDPKRPLEHRPLQPRVRQ